MKKPTRPGEGRRFVREVFAYIFDGLVHPVLAPVGYRWGRQCQSCDTILTPHIANPKNYRQCRICRAMTVVGRGALFRFLWRNRQKLANGLI